MMKSFKSAVSFVVLGVLVAGLSACEKKEVAGAGEGTAEKAGQQIDQAAARAGEELNKAAEKTGQGLQELGKKLQSESQEAQKKE